MTPRLLGRIFPRHMRSYPTSSTTSSPPPSPVRHASTLASPSPPTTLAHPRFTNISCTSHNKPLSPLAQPSTLSTSSTPTTVRLQFTAPFHHSPYPCSSSASPSAMSSPAVATDTESIAQLQKYTACDVSDALLKLKVPNAGFLADLNLYCGSPSSAPAATQADVTVRPVSTVLFVPKDQQDSAASLPPSNIPKDAHWVDLACPGTFAILKQPAGQVNAVCGGIMALRMKVLDVKGIIVAGRVRDLVELQSTGLPIWARGTSTVGAGASSKPWATQVPIDIDGLTIGPGDLAVHDPINGVVIIPQDKVAQVLELLPKLTSADDKAKEDVAKGVTVSEAFKRHRG